MSIVKDTNQIFILFHQKMFDEEDEMELKRQHDEVTNTNDYTFFSSHNAMGMADNAAVVPDAYQTENIHR